MFEYTLGTIMCRFDKKSMFARIDIYFENRDTVATDL